ncbi:hypothetical protein ACVC7V_07925 [Hydrogenophaga sp. A37]|uniref:hypothetical protein n=1 Tax=Hydrogenophaga sp. A37 TaxID=1945864 RepID=UPI0009856A60|nr:hypothetical protein [Hydrogenophaga sp. A37]OOG82923.1 hypothetical protein B0E41_13875 [Hydrogenophaga sp. A37]
MTSPLSFLRRLWQPRHPLFWLVVVLNLLSSIMTTLLMVLQPQGLLRGVLTALALLNTLAGWWLLARLWRGSAPLEKDEGA